MKTLSAWLFVFLLLLAVPAEADDTRLVARIGGDEMVLLGEPCKSKAVRKKAEAQGVTYGIPPKDVAKIYGLMRAMTSTIEGKSQPGCWVEFPGAGVIGVMFDSDYPDLQLPAFLFTNEPRAGT